MKNLLLAFIFALAWVVNSQAQIFPGAVTVRATEFNQSPEGAPLRYFKARVEIRTTSGSPYTIEQDCDGSCVFDQLPKGSTLIFSLEKTDEPRIWVNTGDLILITKHINGADTLRHPALLLAADADCNDTINNWDIVVLRKVVLPIDSNLCRSWMFVDAAAILPADPLHAPLPTTITLHNYQGQNLDLEFFAIKIGNVNAQFPEPRARPPLAAEWVSPPQPNPTHSSAWMGVRLSEPAEILLEIFDAGGRLVFSQQLAGQAGAQQIELPATAFPASGLFFWRLSAANRVASGKLARW